MATKRKLKKTKNTFKELSHRIETAGGVVPYIILSSLYYGSLIGLVWAVIGILRIYFGF